MENINIPKNINAEIEILAIIFNKNNAISEIELDTNDFYKPVHQQIYTAMIELYKEEQPISIVSVYSKIGEFIKENGGISYLTNIQNTFKDSQIKYYAKLVKECSNKRKIIKFAKEMMEKACLGKEKVGDILSSFSDKAMKISDNNNKKPKHISEVIIETVGEIEEAYNAGGKITGMASGIKNLDRFLNGFQKGELVTIGARPSMGKTAFALEIAQGLAKENKGLYFQFEMRDTDMVKRLIARNTLIDGYYINRGKLNDSDWSKISHSANNLSQRNLWINEDTNLTIFEIFNIAKQQKMKQGLDFLVIDHLLLVKKTNENERLAIAEITRQCKLMAKSLNICVILLSQLSRGVELRIDKRPLLSDLKESGSIEEDSDKVILLYRDEYYNPDSEEKGVLEADTAKNRNGRVGALRLAFNAKYQFISDLEI
ncbi:replicative DNA helicase [Clostridium cellulovorans]|uniref:DNA 5'-3' helicase n=1 Tax=Clostridium cellulovorans (strain ATCC 35296 / DSM 3052 / OCM 3 / 743B) TaxID=573061 RepID=D9SQ28_CLOC7|nr:replicative DNA helicase [Clostridium cellulovorans]ADL52164.1 DnaB domain protein helicase domain protein [Clostridium cellulovorans 743B]